MTTDWQAWHRAYEDPTSSLSRRLLVVQEAIGVSLDAAPPGPVELLSLCSGDGRDVLGVLEHHRRARDVRARLIDLDAESIGIARVQARSLGLDRVSCVVGDAGDTSLYALDVPPQIVLACGIFGNVTPADVRQTISGLSAMLDVHGDVIWTRHRRPPDQTPEIRGWFADDGFEELSFTEVRDSLAAVGHHRLVSTSDQLVPPQLFTFVGDGTGAHF